MNNSHLILDLDSTVIHSFFMNEEELNEKLNDPEYDFLKNRSKVLKIVDVRDDDPIGRGVVSFVIVVLRPYIKEFLNFILDYFEYISIWSAGHKRYVRAIESIIFCPDNKIYKKKCSKILTRVDCNEITSNSVLKDLESKGFNLKNTLILDDNNTTFVNNPDNAIHIPAYSPKLIKNNITYDDTSLLKLIDWIKNNNVNICQDVRNLNKSNIFI